MTGESGATRPCDGRTDGITPSFIYIDIKQRVSRGLGIFGEIFTSSYFKMALLLRESMLLNAVLYNASVWYNVTKKEMHELSQLDVIFFTLLCNLPTTSPGESYFLELGALNI